LILVVGKLEILDGKRDELVVRSQESVVAARSTAGCLEFAVSADPLDINRVNIHEEWMSKTALDEFRNNGPTDDLFDLVVSFSVKEHEIG